MSEGNNNIFSDYTNFDSNLVKRMEMALRLAKKDNDSKLRVSHAMTSILMSESNNTTYLSLDSLNIAPTDLKHFVDEDRRNGVVPLVKGGTIEISDKLKEVFKFANENPILTNVKTKTSIIDIVISILKEMKYDSTELDNTFQTFFLDYDKFLTAAIDAEHINERGDFDINYGDDFDMVFIDLSDEETDTPIFNSFNGNKKNRKNNSDKLDYQNLDDYCQNLSELAEKGKLDKTFGREDLLDRMYRTLCKKRKGNIILSGREGVGKSNLVEGLAYNIINKIAPDRLHDKRIYSLNLNSIVAGTKYRGEFESKVKGIMEDLDKTENVILFVDEIHTAMGAGGSEGGLDFMNIVKPYLTKNSFQMIGATTSKEYKKYLAKDSAFTRRFTNIVVEEPTISDTIKILHKLKEGYEATHMVKYSDCAINACAQLSHKYMKHLTLPDKAIDIMDDLGVKASFLGKPRKELILEQQAINNKNKRREAVLNGDYSNASVLKEDLNKVSTALLAFKGESKKIPLIKEINVKQIIQEKTGIPVEDASINFKNIETHLKNKVIGQDEAIESVMKSLILNQYSLDETEKPIGTFLFVGYSGVGKTELTKQLTKSAFGSSKNLIRVDCSEYGQQHDVSKLIGAPAGFVGFEEGGILTDAVKQKPFSVILFDEIEKAHDKLFDLLLQITGEGRLSNNMGDTIDFTNTIVIMTSNVGVGELSKKINKISLIGNSNPKESNKSENKDIINTAIKSKFKPEFINRIDKIINFNSFDKNTLRKLIKMELNNLKKVAFTKFNINLNYSEKVVSKIVEQENPIEYGFRPYKRFINESIKTKIALFLSKQDNTPKDLFLKISKGDISLNVK